MYDPHFQTLEDRSKTIDLFRLIAILCLVILHIPYTFENTDMMKTISGSLTSITMMGWYDSLIIFMENGLGRVASPALGLVSAWFLLKGLDNRSFGQIAQRRAINLLVPFFFWNIIALIFFSLIFIVFHRDEIGLENHSWANILWTKILSPFEWPLNGPLHYLRDLFLITVTYAACHPFLKNKPRLVLVLAFISPLFLLTLGKSGDWLGDNMHTPLPRADLVFYFLIGVVTYKYQDFLFDIKFVRWVTHPLTLTALFAIVLLTSRFMFYYTEYVPLEPTVTNMSLYYLTLLLRGISSMLVFALALLSYKTFHCTISRKMVFRIFCAHAMIAYVVNGTLNNILHSAGGVKAQK